MYNEGLMYLLYALSVSARGYDAHATVVTVAVVMRLVVRVAFGQRVLAASEI